MPIISFKDKEYPAMLAETAKPPKKLFIQGNIPSFNNLYEKNIPVVAMVGTRRPTAYGKEMAFSLARDLARAGAVVVSGLALGIDAQAHKGALEGGGVTWAVLGSGIENIQPSFNRPLAEEIIRKNGLIISEYEGKTDATKWTFPERNRIVAGLTHATIVVEAPERSGALITARLALDANREVGAVPGEATSVHSLGTNKLIKEGASIIRNAQDILELVGFEAEEGTLPFDTLSEIEHSILHSLEGSKTADELALLLECDVRDMSAYLSGLELAGVIKNKGGRFVRLLDS